MKNILITGGEGFIGSNLINKLDKLYSGIDIYSLDNNLSRSNIIKKSKKNRITYIRGQTKSINKYFVDKDIDIVFHFGEFSRIVASFNYLDQCISSNVLGTVEVINFCLKRNIKLIYSASSSKFGNNGKDEHLSPYSWTKSKNIELIKNFSNWYELKYEILYFYNVYGEGHIRRGKMAAVIGIFEDHYLNNKPLPIVAPGTQKRDFTHVTDIIDGVIKSCKMNTNSEYMLGTNKLYSILEIAKLFNHKYVFVSHRKGERISSKIPDINSQLRLGYKAKIDIKDYILEFIRKNKN